MYKVKSPIKFLPPPCSGTYNNILNYCGLWPKDSHKLQTTEKLSVKRSLDKSHCLCQKRKKIFYFTLYFRPLHAHPSLSCFLLLSLYSSVAFSLPLCFECALWFISEISRREGSWWNSNILPDLFLVNGPEWGEELSLWNG